MQTLLQLYPEQCRLLCLEEPPAQQPLLNAHNPPPLLLLHWDHVLGGGKGKQAAGLPRIKPLLFAMVQDYL